MVCLPGRGRNQPNSQIRAHGFAPASATLGMMTMLVVNYDVENTDKPVLRSKSEYSSESRSTGESLWKSEGVPVRPYDAYGSSP